MPANRVRGSILPRSIPFVTGCGVWPIAEPASRSSRAYLDVFSSGSHDIPVIKTRLAGRQVEHEKWRSAARFVSTTYIRHFSGAGKGRKMYLKKKSPRHPPRLFVGFFFIHISGVAKSGVMHD